MKSFLKKTLEKKVTTKYYLQYFVIFGTIKLQHPKKGG